MTLLEGRAVFGVADYIVFGAMLVISAGIGVYYRFTGGKQKTAEEYLLADRGMAILPVAFSLMASFMSAITLLGVSAENYTFGAIFVLINISYGLFTPIAAYLYLPVFFNLQATSAYEYLERRFGLSSRVVASLIFSVQMIVYMGVVLYAPAIALEAVTGLPKIHAIVSVGLVCTFYSTIGGLKAVLITDVFQSLLMFAALFCVIFSAWAETGSLTEIWHIAGEHGRLNFANFTLDPTERHTLWSLLIGGGFTFLSLYGVNQAQVQRYLSVKDLKTAQKCLWWNWPVLSLMSILTCFSGLCIFSKYADCDPLKAGVISTSDQLMPLYVIETVGHLPGLSGLFVAGIFSAALSTVSAAVNSLAAVTLEDYIKPAYIRVTHRVFPDKMALPKIIAFIYGLVCVGIAFLAEYLGGVLQAALTIFGVIGGPLLGFFTLGMTVPSANETGALSGLFASIAVSLWLGFGGPKPPPKPLPVSVEGCNSTRGLSLLANATLSTPATLPEDSYMYLYRLSYLWLVVIGFLVTWLLGVLISYVSMWVGVQKRVPASCMNPDLFWPPIANVLRKKSRREGRNGFYNVKALNESAFPSGKAGGDSESLTTRF